MLALRGRAARASALAALALVACAGRAPRPAEPAAPATALADAYVAAYFERFPEIGTIFAYPGADHGRLTDESPEALRAWERRQDDFLARARALPASAAPGTPEWVSRGILVEELESATGVRGCRLELWSVGAFSDLTWRLGPLAAVQPVGTAALREAAVRRVRAVPRHLDARIANLREGLRLGFAATRENVERTLSVLDGLAATAPEDSPFVAPARRDPDAAFAAALAAAAVDARAATERYRAFLRTEYLPRAREAQGVSALPGGEACYAAALRKATTLAATPREVHELGLARLRAVRAEMESLAERAFGTRDVGALLEAMRTEPRFTYRTSEEILDETRAAIARAQAAAPRWFERVPRAPVRVEPFPAYQERAAPVERYAPSRTPAGLVGVYFINAFDPAHKSRAGTESTAFHEAVPGHHFQIALALERADLPPIGRYLVNAAFAEGWALYAERLADEMRVYGGDVDRMGMLSSEAFRAARLVIDSGLHAYGWSRERAIAYLLANTSANPAFAASEVDRYAANPGQATAYMTGAIEIRKLREAAAAALGDRFDVRAFHEAVLDGGAITLPMLRERVGAWIAARRRG